MTQQTMAQVSEALERAGYRTEIDASEGEITVFGAQELRPRGRVNKIAHSFGLRSQLQFDGTIAVTAR
jgi:hypothetical protein